MAGHLPPGFRRVFRRELRHLLRHPSLAVMLGPFPLILMLVLSAVFSAGLPTGLPIAVVDRDGTTLSRQVTRMLDNSPDLEVALRLPDLGEGKRALLAGEVYAVILIPENMERDLFQARRPELVSLYNNQLLTIGRIVSRATNSVFATFSAGAANQALISNGELPEEAAQAVVPIPVQQSPLFNPALDYVYFLLAALMPTMLQIFVCASAALTIATDAQSAGGMRRLVRLGGTPLRALAGKLAPYGLAYLLTLVLADAIMFGFFGAPFHGNIWLHMVYTVSFVLACLCLGGTLAMVAGNTVGALGLTGVLTGPAFGFAGISFPRITMNNFAWAWGAMLPLTPYLQLRTDQVLRGAPVDVSLPTLGWSMGLAALYGLLLLFLTHRAANRPAEMPEAAA